MAFFTGLEKPIGRFLPPEPGDPPELVRIKLKKKFRKGFLKASQKLQRLDAEIKVLLKDWMEGGE
jgi:hypothetical protein